MLPANLPLISRTLFSTSLRAGHWAVYTQKEKNFKLYCLNEREFEGTYEIKVEWWEVRCDERQLIK